MSALDPDASLLTADFESFKRQEALFASLNIILIAALLVSHTIFATYFSGVSGAEIATLGFGLVAEGIELVWLRRSEALSTTRVSLVIWWSIALNTGLATALSLMTANEDSQYFVLMVVPVLEAAFRFNFATTVAVIAIANVLNFVGVYTLASVSEYFEAGTTSLIYTLVGVLVWLLVNNLRKSEARLKRNFAELELAREKLTGEEKLAAVGRLASSIAHEIRNPVAMIASSLATAARVGQSEAERNEMFEIATKEAARLERLTNDFLAYARPRLPQMKRTNVAETLNYVAAVARAHSAGKMVTIEVAADEGLEGEFDPPQIHQALLNLVLNAVDACDSGKTVTLSATRNGKGTLRLDVTNGGKAIPAETTTRIFEPFFTTKAGGTGLGLAISRNIAQAHKGNAWLRINQPGEVCFSIEIPARA